MNDDNESLGYVSSVDAFEPPKGTPSIDVADEKALVRLVRMVEDQIQLFHTISGMRRFDRREFTAEQREAMSAEMVMILSSFKQSAQNAIDGIKEKGK